MSVRRRCPYHGVMLDERKSEILRALIEQHIESGEPVSSRVILDASGLTVSAATVRSELAALEVEGYVVQPHTSAGRIPTASAYRYYVDQLSRRALRPTASLKISEFFSSVHIELSRLLKSTSSLLSEITTYPAVVTGPGLGGESVRGVHLVQMGTDVVLVVLVTDAGRVTQEIAKLGAPADPSAIEAAELIILREIINTPLATRLDPSSLMTDDVPETVRAIVRTVCETAFETVDRARDLYVGPTSYLTNAWADISKMQTVLEILEREAALLEVLSLIPEGTAVQIGPELGLDADADIAMVSTSYGTAGEPSGRLGVIGPMRMDYGRAITAVEEVGDSLGESLGTSSGSS